VKGKEILPPAQYVFLPREPETKEVLHTTIEEEWGMGVWKRGDGGNSSLLVRQKKRI